MKKYITRIFTYCIFFFTIYGMCSFLLLTQIDKNIWSDIAEYSSLMEYTNSLKNLHFNFTIVAINLSSFFLVGYIVSRKKKKESRLI